MRDREDPKVIEHLKAENLYTKAVLKHTEPDQKFLYEEMKGRIKEDDSSVPYFKNGYWYYSRYEKDKEYPINCRKRESLNQEEEILIDENEEAKKHPYYDLISMAITRDNKIMAFTEDITGRRQYRIRFKNLETGKILDHSIEHCSHDMAWLNDGSVLYYCEKDKETLRPNRIMAFHMESGKSSAVYEENDETYICGVFINKDFEHILIGSQSSLTTEFRIKSAHDERDFEIFLAREEEHEYYPELDGEKVVIRTNKNAENFRIMECTVSDRAFENWKEVQAHNPEVYVEDFEVFTHHYAVLEKENGLSKLKVHHLKDNSSKVVPNREETYMMYLGTNPEMDQKTVRIGYSSLTTPHSVIDVDMDSFEEEIKKQQTVLGDFSPDKYQSERVWALGHDGVKIPVSLVYHKGHFKKDGSNPLLIYGYGSYGSTVDPYFSTIRLSLLNRGFVFAIAHVRGGEYLGRHWYDSGKMLDKKNTFYDFISSTEYLIDQKYADAKNVFAMGGSAGGLLMGAVSNMRPDLWKGIVSQVPFVDVISTMMDDSIPLTTGEYDEWGNPNEKLYYDYMLSYSPYDNIEKQDYPAMLVTSGLHDSQVQYWEPTKYVAKLREYKTNDSPILLYTNMEAGHGGASGRFETLKEYALEYVFILWMAGVKVR